MNTDRSLTRILGIDPGYGRLGIAIIDKNFKEKETVVYSDCFETSKTENIHNRFLQVGNEIEKIISKFKPDILAIETLFITKNQKTAMHVAESRGIIIYEAMKHGLEIYEFSPMEIKTSITGDGSSDKSHIIKMVHLLVEIPKNNARDD
ncbi:MAG: crossover junction endodeoxyribonuclease RuvC, partial [Candidatus Taylorbacteria bacterium]|nr:crossover junction endodeoxyribonuclease RuvC [Candidatus Taylorbacteria bacterium]